MNIIDYVRDRAAERKRMTEAIRHYSRLRRRLRVSTAYRGGGSIGRIEVRNRWWTWFDRQSPI